MVPCCSSGAAPEPSCACGETKSSPSNEKFKYFTDGRAEVVRFQLINQSKHSQEDHSRRELEDSPACNQPPFDAINFHYVNKNVKIIITDHREDTLN